MCLNQVTKELYKTRSEKYGYSVKYMSEDGKLYNWRLPHNKSDITLGEYLQANTMPSNCDRAEYTNSDTPLYMIGFHLWKSEKEAIKIKEDYTGHVDRRAIVILKVTIPKGAMITEGVQLIANKEMECIVADTAKFELTDL